MAGVVNGENGSIYTVLDLPREFAEIGQKDIMRIPLKVETLGDSRLIQEAELLEICDINFKTAREFLPDSTSFRYHDTNLDKYLDLISSRSQENKNSDPNSQKYKVYLERLGDLLSYARGRCLDIGADNPETIFDLLPSSVSYLGIEPQRNDVTPGVYLGLAEFLPFHPNSFDTVMFNTSLDHILDVQLALDNAKRVLKRGGRLIISSLVWLNDYELWKDDVHFHHFKPFEIENFVSDCNVIYCRTYQYGVDKHRYGVFLVAETNKD